MKKTGRYALCAAVLSAALLLCSAGQMSCEPLLQPSSDTVPRASWVMDALGRLAADGKTQPFAARDFLASRSFTRIEIADIVRDMKVVNGHTWDRYSDTQKAVIRQLADEFRAELVFLGEDLASYEDGLETAADRVVLSNLWAYGQVARDGSDTTGFAVIADSVLGLRGRSAVFSAALTSESRLFHPESYHSFRPLDRVSYRLRSREWSCSLGMEYTWFGTASTGSLWLGDASPAILQASAAKSFSLGRALGRWRMSWQVGGFNDMGSRVYLINKRWEKTLSSQWSFAYTDMAKTTETPNPLMLLVPSWAYQSMFLSDVDAKWNSVLGLEAIYRPSRKLETYAQWMVDDLNNPFDTGESVPKKTGLLFGMRSRSGEPMDAGLRLTAEYGVVDTKAYEATRVGLPHLAWSQDGLPLAWPYGANSRTLSLRAEKKLGRRWDVVSSFTGTRQKEGGGEQSALSVRPTLQITPRASVGVILGRQWGDRDATVVGVSGMYVY